jgi:hypothetical protein
MNKFTNNDIIIIFDEKYYRCPKAYPQYIKDKLIENFPWSKSLGESRYCLKNKIFLQPICPVCDKNFVKYISRNCRYSLSCSKICKYNSVERKEKYKNTCIEKYGVDHPFKNEIINQKRIDTWLDNYGVTNPFAAKEIKEKIEKDNLKKHGVKNSHQRKDVKEKFKNTMMERYGASSSFESPELMEKARLTHQEKLGVDNPMQSILVREKSKNTSMERYGVEHPGQNPEIHEKMQKYRWYDVTLPSGKTVKLQGYERYYIFDLLKKYNEKEIIVLRKDMPEIWWIDDYEKKHRYFADFYIPKDNLLIDVKSMYTYSLKRDKIKLMKIKERYKEFNLQIIIYEIGKDPIIL